MSIREEDNGCDLYPDCLTCPFPKCRYDYHRGSKSVEVVKRNKKIMRQYIEGVTCDELGYIYNLTSNYIQAIVRKYYRESG